MVRSQTAIESKTQLVGDCIPGLRGYGLVWKYVIQDLIQLCGPHSSGGPSTNAGGPQANSCGPQDITFGTTSQSCGLQPHHT